MSSQSHAGLWKSEAYGFGDQCLDSLQSQNSQNSNQQKVDAVNVDANAAKPKMRVSQYYT